MTVSTGFVSTKRVVDKVCFFGLFNQTLQFLQQIYVKKCPSSIQCQDSNPRSPYSCYNIYILLISGKRYEIGLSQT